MEATKARCRLGDNLQIKSATEVSEYLRTHGDMRAGWASGMAELHGVKFEITKEVFDAIDKNMSVIKLLPAGSSHWSGTWAISLDMCNLLQRDPVKKLVGSYIGGIASNWIISGTDRLFLSSTKEKAQQEIKLSTEDGSLKVDPNEDDYLVIMQIVSVAKILSDKPKAQKIEAEEDDGYDDDDDDDDGYEDDDDEEDE